ncbi:ankyrin repeat, PH and SEC7 domain containing protein secG-like [Phymastichus coffea]|uniref:ankyrin repeat, PH and SEC7 domain containing protein secG-like n=1 Tax=Phymastichus coffea TaxID=108790 RepID=UPI00273AF190|nr:ankyrin repeat, PH and SEC7 domain containing protein secG-like [Phymastichus coffea]
MILVDKHYCATLIFSIFFTIMSINNHMLQYRNLFEAIINDDTAYFCFLLESITWPRTTDYLDFELFTTALEFGRKYIANHLLDKKCRIAQPDSDIHAIHLALANYTDFSDIIKRLLALGGSVSAKNSSGNNAIHLAFINEASGRTVDMLLLKYIDETNENAKNADGLSILHIVCTRPNLVIMKKFFENRNLEELNCQVDLQCDSNFAGQTPLHFAVSYGHKEIIKYLVTNLKVDAFIQDANKSTPLHLALKSRNNYVIDLIMAYNFPQVVNKDIVNNSGVSHFMVACAASNQDFAIKFMQIESGRSRKSLDTLINRQVNIPKDNYDQAYAGYFPIHFAAEFGRANTVQQLVHFGASFFVETATNLSPLVLALKYGNHDIVRLIFWCYKQYRLSIFTDEDYNLNKAYNYSIGSQDSDHWYQCRSRCSSPNA